MIGGGNTYEIHQAAEACDTLYPGWHDKIEISMLNMDDVTWCMGGQLARAYKVRRSTENEAWYVAGHAVYEALNHEISGVFSCDSVTRQPWINEIMARREGAVVPAREVELATAGD